MTLKEKRLIEGWISGDSDIQKEFYETYINIIRKAIYNTLVYCRIKYVYDDPIIKDLCQSTFLAIQENKCAALTNFRGECSLSTWLYKIAKNVVFDYVNKNYDRLYGTDSLNDTADENQEHERGDFIPADKPSPAEEIQADERYALAKQYLRELDRDDRRILELFYLEDFSLKQIAKFFDTNEDALFMRKKRLEEEIRKRYIKDTGL